MIRNAEYLSASKGNIPFLLNGHEIRVTKVTEGEGLQCVSLGPAGTFSENASLQLLSGQADLSFVKTNAAIIEQVDQGKFDLGVVAFENSTEGTVAQTLKAIIHPDVRILGEKTMQIHQNLFGTKRAWEKAMEREKKVVHSHPQAFAQAGKWLSGNLPGYTPHETDSTADGVRIAKKKTELGIGDMRAGEIYKLPLIAKNIEDNDLNFTRFWLVGRGDTNPTGNDRTWFAFTLANKPGTLVRVIEAFAKRNISINKIETPPLTMDHYYFFTAIDGHEKDEKVAEALAETDVRTITWNQEPMGSFEKSILPRIKYEPAAYERGWIPDGE